VRNSKVAHWGDILFHCTLYDKPNSITDTEVFKTLNSVLPKDVEWISE